MLYDDKSEYTIICEWTNNV